VTWKFGVGLTIVEKMFQRDVTLKSGEEILGRDTVTSFIEHDRHELARMLKETQQQSKFRNSVERTTSVPANTTGSTRSSEVDDGISEEVDVR
jgi:hypothetical protein